MNNTEIEIKLEFITGLEEIVMNEVTQNPRLKITEKKENYIYLAFINDFSQIINLKSVLKAHIVTQSKIYNPKYLSKHKSIIGNLVELILENNKNDFKSFKIFCAGSQSTEIRSIADYIKNTYKIYEDESADLKIHLIKMADTWELGAQITPRPLSLRTYKVKNMEGAMDPTIAYAVNSLCGLNKANSYLNIFSGSATLLIEAGQCYPMLKKLIGFDNNKETLSLAMRNIKASGLIKKIKLKEADIFDNPELGKFDVIASDLPFGMLISKHESLERLYQRFIEYCQESLHQKGTLAVYTVKYDILKKLISASKFKIVKNIELKIFTSANNYLYPNIFICKFK